MKLQSEFVKYVSDSDGAPVKLKAELIKLTELSRNFSRGSLFMITNLTYLPKKKTYQDELFVISNSLNSSNLTWQSYAGYHTGNRTLLDFSPDVGVGEVSAEKLKRDLESFYNEVKECRFSIESVYFIDGWLEIRRS